MAKMISNEQWKKTITDVETAFLYGTLDKVLFMQCPPGYSEIISELIKDGNELMNETKNKEDIEYVMLKKSIYGLVQAARVWWKNLWKVLHAMRFEKCLNDGCLFRRMDGLGEVIICAYVDDMLIVGDDNAVNDTHKELGDVFNITIEEAKEFLGCKWIRNENSYWIHQPAILKKIDNAFGEEVKCLKKYPTPSGEAFKVNKVRDGEPNLEKDKQNRYRSGIGMCLYLSRHSRPDICNATRELSKGMVRANDAHYKQMLRLIKYILTTKGLCLKQTTINGPWKITGLCDSDYAGDNDTRKSVTGYVIYLNGLIICWKSKGQSIVTLSSTEAEYVAATDITTELLFIKQVMKFLGMGMKDKMNIKIDNQGALFLSKNEYACHRTKILM